MSNKFSNKFPFILICSVLFLAVLFFSRAPAASYLFQQGIQAKQEWQLEKASRYFTWLLLLQPDNSTAKYEKGLTLQLRGNFLASQIEFESLQKQPVNDLALKAQLLNSIGVNHFNFNEPDKAIEHHLQSLEIAKQIQSKSLQSQALINLSRVLYYSKGQGEEALKQLEEALQFSREIKDENSEADALRNAGVIYWWHRGEREKPLSDYYFPALEIYRRQNNLHGAAVTLSNISLAYWAKGDAFQFLKHQSESMSIKERIGDLAGLSDSYLYYSWYFANLQNYRKTREYLIQSLELSRSIGYELTKNEAEATLVPIYTELKDYDNAIKLLKVLLERDRANPILFKYRTANLGICYQLKGEPVKAREYFEQELELNKKAGSESEVGMLTRIGETYQDTDEWERAAEYLTKAEEIGFKEKEKNWWYWLRNKRAFVRQMEHYGQHDKALKYLLEATEIESLIVGSNGVSAMQGQNKEVYNQAFSTLLENTEVSKTENELAFRLLEQLKYRAIKKLVLRVSDQKETSKALAEKEQIALKHLLQESQKLKDGNDLKSLEQLRHAYSEYEHALLQSQLNETQYNIVREASPVNAEKAQLALDNETAIIEYIFTDDKAFALIITRSSLRSVALPVTKENLAAKVKLMRAMVFGKATSENLLSASQVQLKNSFDSDWHPVAEDLHNALIKPIEQTGILKNIRRIGFVPYGFLHNLPFAALVRNDATGSKFLIEDYTLFQIPSATFLANSSRQTKSFEKTMLSFGIKADEEGFQQLLFAEEEATNVAALFNQKAHINSSATETNFKQLAPFSKYIHFATHAVSENMMPLLSRLKLYKSTEDDGNLTVREIFNLRLNTDLVTLGACRTGQSNTMSGNQISEVDRISLHEAFLNAGSSSVLSTLFPIEDRSTMEFMKTFYTNLQTMDKAEALTATQRAALRGVISFSVNNQTHQLTHPRHWAAFILVGNYR